MPAQLRQVARQERNNKSVLQVEDIEVGVRLNHSCLLSALQLYIYQKPNSQFAANLRLAGRMSRDSKTGSGFVKLYFDRIEVPTRDWEAVEQGSTAPGVSEIIPLNESVTTELKKLCRAAYEHHIEQLLDDLAWSLRGLWSADSPILDVRGFVRGVLLADAYRGTLENVEHFGDWVSSMLANTYLSFRDSVPL